MFWLLKNSDPDPQTLAALPIGGEARILRIVDACSGPARRRLLDLGLTPGARIRAELRSPGGDPTGYRVRGTVVALRREQAEQILIDPTGPIGPIEPTDSGDAEPGRTDERAEEEVRR